MTLCTPDNQSDVAVSILDAVNHSRHESVVEHRRRLSVRASGVVDDVRVTSEAAHGTQVSDIVKRVAGDGFGK